jgi:hypothetical protein
MWQNVDLHGSTCVPEIICFEGDKFACGVIVFFHQYTGGPALARLLPYGRAGRRRAPRYRRDARERRDKRGQSPGLHCFPFVTRGSGSCAACETSSWWSASRLPGSPSMRAGNGLRRGNKDPDSEGRVHGVRSRCPPRKGNLRRLHSFSAPPYPARSEGRAAREGGVWPESRTYRKTESKRSRFNLFSSTPRHPKLGA